MLYYLDPNKPWIIEMDASKTALAGMLLQLHKRDGITQEVLVTFISYNFTRMQQLWSTTERELYTIFVAVRKFYYMINGGRVMIRTDHRPRVEIVAGTAKVQNSAASEKLHCWTSEILAIRPVIEYKKGSTNVIADSLSRLRMDEHYNYSTPLENNKPILLEEDAEINMVQTHARTAEQGNTTQRLPKLQVRVKDILQVSDKRQLIMNADNILKSLNPARLQELQDSNPSIINLQRTRKTSITADENNVLSYTIDFKGKTIKVFCSPRHSYCG